MKKVSPALLLFMAVLIAAPILNSCKKGPEDPWFSFYSRKTRLCQNWKVTSYKQIILTNDSTVSYTFDGQTYRVTKSNYTYYSPGSMRILFSKTGSYQWDLSVTTDTSTYIYTEKGMWYFTGGSKESGTKQKELVAMQKTEHVESFSDIWVNTSLSYNGSGDLDLSTYKIRKLASDEVILESEAIVNYVTLGINTTQKTNVEIILELQ